LFFAIFISVAVLYERNLTFKNKFQLKSLFSKVFHLFCRSSFPLPSLPASTMIGFKPRGVFIILTICFFLGNVILPDQSNARFIKSDPFLIQYNKVGKLALGGYLKEIFWNYSKNRIGKVFIHEGQEIFSQYEILSPDQKEVLFSVEPDCRIADSLCIIKRIEIYSPEFHTAEKIHVGMLYQDLTHAGLKITYLGWHRGNLIARTAFNPMDYVLSTEGIPKKWFSTMDPHMIPFSTKIIGIVLTGPEMEGFTFRQYDSLMFGAKFVSNNLLISQNLKSNTKLSQDQSTKASMVSSTSKAVSPDNKIISSIPNKPNKALAESNAPKSPAPSNNLPLQVISKSKLAPMPNLDPKWVVATVSKSTYLNSKVPTPGIKMKTLVNLPVFSKPRNESIALNENKAVLTPKTVSPNPVNNPAVIIHQKEDEKPAIDNYRSKASYIIASSSESIYTVSQRYNLSVSEIFDYNPFLSLRKMKAGDKIYLVNKDSVNSLQAYDVDPYHTKGPVSKVYLQTKDYTYGNTNSPSDSLSSKRPNTSNGVKN